MPGSRTRTRPGGTATRLGSSAGGDLPALRELARGHGIQLSYRDMTGKRQEAAPEVLRALLKLWGTSGENPREIREALREAAQRRWRQAVPLVVVAWDGRPAKVELRLPACTDPGQVYCKLHFEDGRCRSLDWRSPVSAEIQVEERTYQVRQLLLPALPFGYHELELEVRGRVHRSWIISAPTRSYTPPEPQRNWGLFLPLYALHSQSSWGAGNLGDWRRLTEWAAGLGSRVAATLPLLASSLEPPLCEPSPYSPASRLFWNEFYLEIEAVPEFSGCLAARRLVRSRAFQAQLQAFRQSPLIDYQDQMAARRQVLEKLAKAFFRSNSARHREFQQFLRERPRVRDYAEFRAVLERAGQPWPRWEERLQQGKLQAGDYDAKARDYHLYVQWLAQEQIGALRTRCGQIGVQLCLDLPLGTHPAGYDLWRERDFFAVAASAGAPPDMFFTKGQNWGFAPLHPQHLRERRYDYYLEYLRFQMRHTALLRIDHIMGLHRLYWIPPGFPAAQGAYVSYPAEEFLALLSLESHRHRTVILGENLGTVPPEVNEAMARHGLRQTYVVQYEQRPAANAPLRPPPALAVASLNTHDMPTFAAHWLGHDIDDRADLGLIPKDDLPRQHRRRRKLNFALATFLRRNGFLKGRETNAATVLRACLGWLARSPAETVLLSLEDLWQEECPQNVPGTCAERPNWRRKTRLGLEAIQNSAAVRAWLAQVARSRT